MNWPFRKPEILSKSPAQAVGGAQEDRALEYLKSKGWTLLERNYRGKFGEIDLIMQGDGGAIVFVEARFRRTDDFGGGVFSVGRSKQERVLKTALQYVKERRLQGSDFRFDVVALSPGRVEHIENAFSSDSYTL